MTFRNYLAVMFCILITLFVLLLAGLLIRLVWEAVIEPIMDRIKEQRDTYYKDLYHKKLKECDGFKHKLDAIGLRDNFIDCLKWPYCKPMISKAYVDEHTYDGEAHVMIKFTVSRERYEKNIGEVDIYEHDSRSNS